MKLCVRIEGVRERLRDGSLTLDAAAQLQAAFERRDRERAREARSAMAGAGSATRPYRSAPAGPARPPAPKPMLDMSAQKALVEEAVGKSTRQVMQMLAEVDPALARVVGSSRWRSTRSASAGWSSSRGCSPTLIHTSRWGNSSGDW